MPQRRIYEIDPRSDLASMSAVDPKGKGKIPITTTPYRVYASLTANIDAVLAWVGGSTHPYNIDEINIYGDYKQGEELGKGLEELFPRHFRYAGTIETTERGTHVIVPELTVKRGVDGRNINEIDPFNIGLLLIDDVINASDNTADATVARRKFLEKVVYDDFGITRAPIVIFASIWGMGDYGFGYPLNPYQISVANLTVTATRQAYRSIYGHFKSLVRLAFPSLPFENVRIAGVGLGKGGFSVISDIKNKGLLRDGKGDPKLRNSMVTHHVIDYGGPYRYRIGEEEVELNERLIIKHMFKDRERGLFHGLLGVDDMAWTGECMRKFFYLFYRARLMRALELIEKARQEYGADSSMLEKFSAVANDALRAGSPEKLINAIKSYGGNLDETVWRGVTKYLYEIDQELVLPVVDFTAAANWSPMHGNNLGFFRSPFNVVPYLDRDIQEAMELSRSRDEDGIREDLIENGGNVLKTAKKFGYQG